MGVVIKQSFWGTFISYLGVAVGYLNTLYFRLEYFTPAQIGLFTLVTAHAMTISPFSSLGTGSTYLKYFPSFNEENKHRLFSFLFLIAIVGNTIVLLTGFAFKDVIALRYVEKAPEYLDFMSITGMVIVSNSFFELFFNYSRSIMKVVFPSFLRDIYLRLGSLSLVMGFAFEWWGFNTAVFGLGVVYLSALVLLFSQLVLFHGFRFDFKMGSINAEWRNRIFRFGGYSMLVAGSFALYNNASYDQITAYLGTDAMGVFQTCFFIAIIVEMPRRNMAKVMGPIISKESEGNNMKEIKSLYQRGSLTMGVIGTLLFIGITTNLNDLFNFIPNGDEFRIGYWIVIMVCYTKLSLMISSFAAEIINFSPLYRYNLIFQLTATFLLLTLNYFFIPLWGINGAGIAFLIATLTHIILKFFFVGYHFGMYPLTKSHVPLIIITLIVLAFAFWFQTNWHPVISIVIRSVLTTVLFLFPVYYFKVSKDINKLIRSTFERFFKIKLSR